MGIVKEAFREYARLRDPAEGGPPPWIQFNLSRRAKLIALGALVLSVLGAYVWRYQPIVPRGNSYKGLCFEDIGEFHRPSGFSTTITRSTCWADGSEVKWGMSVTKRGLIPVTVTGVELPDVFYLANERVRMHRAQGWDKGDLPFAPFRLTHDHDAHFVILAGTYDGCDDPKRSATWTIASFDDIVVHYSILGFDRTARVPLPYQAQIPCFR